LIAHGIGDGSVPAVARLASTTPAGRRKVPAPPSEEGPHRPRRRGVSPPLRHAIEERAQRGVIIARRREAGRGDDRVEFAGEQDEAEQEDEGRQENDGKDDPAPQGFDPRFVVCHANLAHVPISLNPTRPSCPAHSASEDARERAYVG
jgi:hypothetical protein